LAIKRAVALVSPRYTMVAVPRLRRLVEHANLLHREAVRGGVVECGTWRGGSLALVDWAFRTLGDPRPLWGFDSFEGLPPPGERDPAEAHRGFFHGWCAALPDDVRNAIRALGGSANTATLVAGWLGETLPRTETGPIAFLNIDVDWYESVKAALAALVDRVEPGGVINVDDYGRWEGCDRAVHEFLDGRGWSRSLIQRTGRHGAWFRIARTR
jgi:O-methyltransferase